VNLIGALIGLLVILILVAIFFHFA